MKAITTGLYGVLTKLQLVNFYVLDTGSGIAVIDIGLGESDVDTLERELATISKTLDDVTYILITHAHPDHIGGLPELQKRTDAKTIIGAADAPFARGEVPAPAAPSVDGMSFLDRFMYRQLASQATMPKPSEVHIEVNDGDVLNEVYPDLTVIDLRGHSPGQVGYWFPKSKTLIGGDVMMNLPFAGLTKPLRPVSPDWVAAHDAIRKVESMHPTNLCLGHGPVLLGNASEKIAQFVAKI